MKKLVSGWLAAAFIAGSVAGADAQELRVGFTLDAQTRV